MACNLPVRKSIAALCAANMGTIHRTAHRFALAWEKLGVLLVA
jgi:hypothetical protein